MISDQTITEIINTYLPIRNEEKNKYGEVFTSPVLIRDMYNQLPKHVWSNPLLKWLDPTGGVGNFLLIAYQKLMIGLEPWELDEGKRSQHILNNMLYTVEINEENTSIMKQLFVNVLHEDFLQSNVFDLFFDVIIGNPPFQDIVIGKKRIGCKNKLYERITSKCIDILNPGGYLLFIVPDNMFSGNTSIYLKMMKLHLILLHFDKKIQTFFPKIQQSFCYFLLEKIAKNENGYPVQIVGQDNEPFECVLTSRQVNPVRNWSHETETLMSQYMGSTINTAIYHRGKPLALYLEQGLYPLIFKSDKKLFVNRLDLAPGLGQKKVVIFIISPQLHFEIDFTGEFGVGPNTMYIPFQTDEEGLLLVDFFNSDIYKILALATKVNRQFLKIKFIQYLNLNKVLSNNDNDK